MLNKIVKIVNTLKDKYGIKVGYEKPYYGHKFWIDSGYLSSSELRNLFKRKNMEIDIKVNEKITEKEKLLLIDLFQLFINAHEEEDIIYSFEIRGNESVKPSFLSMIETFPLQKIEGLVLKENMIENGWYSSVDALYFKKDSSYIYYFQEYGKIRDIFQNLEKKYPELQYKFPSYGHLKYEEFIIEFHGEEYACTLDTENKQYQIIVKGEQSRINVSEEDFLNYFEEAFKKTRTNELFEPSYRNYELFIAHVIRIIQENESIYVSKCDTTSFDRLSKILKSNIEADRMFAIWYKILENEAYYTPYCIYRNHYFAIFRFEIKNKKWYVYGDYNTSNIYFTITENEEVPMEIQERMLEIQKEHLIEQLKKNDLVFQ
jgi:hypothetical protein